MSRPTEVKPRNLKVEMVGEDIVTISRVELIRLVLCSVLVGAMGFR